jgi:hypothetical protein
MLQKKNFTNSMKQTQPQDEIASIIGEMVRDFTAVDKVNEKLKTHSEPSRAVAIGYNAALDARKRNTKEFMT